MADAGKSGRDLAEGYAAMIADSDVLTLGLDMGGDILARFPSPIEGDDHPEKNVRSPNTDGVFLDMLTELEGKGLERNNVMLGVSAAGGDGEMGPALFEYLQEMFLHG